MGRENGFIRVVGSNRRLPYHLGQIAMCTALAFVSVELELMNFSTPTTQVRLNSS